MAARSLQESMPRQLSGQARPANWGGAGGLTFVARLPGLTFYVQSSLNAACLRTCPIWREMAVEFFHVDIYMWESMGQRDRSVRLAELPLQQRRMLPKSISTPLPPVAPAGAWSAGGIEAISPKHTN